MLTLLNILKRTADFLGSKGVENSRLNAEILVGHALGLKRMQLYLQFERPLSEVELEKIRPLVRRRSLREPLQYILGETEWFGMKLKVDTRALIPRPETERLLEILTETVTVPPPRILDLGTGSGALALGLARHYPNAVVSAVDESASALALAAENAATLGLTGRINFVRSDWFSSLPTGARYELIAANPPYLSVEETAATEPEVRNFEPVSALASGNHGKAALMSIIQEAPHFLEIGGLLALETGTDQHADLLNCCAKAGFLRSESRPDLTGRDRFVLAWLLAPFEEGKGPATQD